MDANRHAVVDIGEVRLPQQPPSSNHDSQLRREEGADLPEASVQTSPMVKEHYNSHHTDPTASEVKRGAGFNQMETIEPVSRNGNGVCQANYKEEVERSVTPDRKRAEDVEIPDYQWLISGCGRSSLKSTMYRNSSNSKSTSFMSRKNSLSSTIVAQIIDYNKGDLASLKIENSLKIANFKQHSKNNDEPTNNSNTCLAVPTTIETKKLSEAVRVKDRLESDAIGGPPDGSVGRSPTRLSGGRSMSIDVGAHAPLLVQEKTLTRPKIQLGERELVLIKANSVTATNLIFSNNNFLDANKGDQRRFHVTYCDQLYIVDGKLTLKDTHLIGNVSKYRKRITPIKPRK